MHVRKWGGERERGRERERESDRGGVCLKRGRREEGGRGWGWDQKRVCKKESGNESNRKYFPKINSPPTVKNQTPQIRPPGN